MLKISNIFICVEQQSKKIELVKLVVVVLVSAKQNNNEFNRLLLNHQSFENSILVCVVVVVVVAKKKEISSIRIPIENRRKQTFDKKKNDRCDDQS